MPKDIQQGHGHVCKVNATQFGGSGFVFGAKHPRGAGSV